MIYKKSLSNIFILLISVIFIGCTGSPSNKTSDWNEYPNEELGYSFKYPSDCTFGPMPANCKQFPPEERHPECLCFLNAENPNEVGMQAFLGEVEDGLTLTTFSVVHYDSPAFNPPEGEDLISWLNSEFSYASEIPAEPNMTISGISAARVYNPGSQQAPSSEEIYIIRDGILIRISMLDVDVEEHRELYENILSTFQFTENPRK
jgi:hypothetical protein